ncbi:MAG: alpha-amylase [Microbacteriaceae bacterium]|nr:alpha-amylase [Microbacteriaceae bacterium]
MRSMVRYGRFVAISKSNKPFPMGGQPAQQPSVSTPYEPLIGRIPIRNLKPRQPENRWPTKAFAGEVVPFQATVFREGHDQIGADLLLIDPRGTQTRHRMSPGAPGTDSWVAEALVPQPGMWSYSVEAYSDDWATWLHNAEIKIPAGIDVDVMFALALELLARATPTPAIAAATAAIADQTLSADTRLAAATADDVTAQLSVAPIASLVTTSESVPVRVERARAGLGSWYEFFPRSEGATKNPDGSWRSGTFRTAAKRLPAVAAMGFDVVYLPPIHPIGRSFRKGPNNTLNAAPDDPGSPWAIGSADGGHDAIHPELGTV